MVRRILIVGVVIALTMAIGIASLSEVPQLISFQGKLHDDAGIPLTGGYELTFRIYSVATGGTALWSETINVECENGLYNVILGGTHPIDLDFEGRYWLGVHASGDSEEMSPRYGLTSAPYALRATYADSAGSVQPSAHDHGGETWTGDGTGNGLTLENYATGLRATGTDTCIVVRSTTGPAIFAVGGDTTEVFLKRDFDLDGTPPDYEKSGMVVGYGISYFSGVHGHSDQGCGVSGVAGGTGQGVYGWSPTGTGVKGESDNGLGGSFHSKTDYGLVAQSDVGKAAKFEGDIQTEGEGYFRSLHILDTEGRSIITFDRSGSTHGRPETFEDMLYLKNPNTGEITHAFDQYLERPP